MMKYLTRLAIAAIAVAGLAASPASAGDKRQEATDLVNDAAETISYFAADSAFEPMWSLADQVKAMVIIPQSLRAGFIFGASGGDAIMVARNKDGTWSQPVFYAIGSFSFGFQAGAEISETVLLVMTERGMEHLLSTSVKLGGDVSIALGPVGGGAKAQTTDILAFSRSRGLYGGLSLEGAVIKTRKNFNKAYYNADVSTTDVIFRGEVYNPASASLQNAVWRLAHKDEPGPLLAPAVGAPPADAPLQETQQSLAPGERPQTTYGAPLNKPKSDTIYEDDAIWGTPVDKEPQ